jgi:hypothetical protein
MRKLLVGMLLVTAAFSVSAQDGKGYVGAGLGVSSYSIDSCDQLPPGFSCDESGFAWKAYAGYMFLPFLGIEGSYLDFGTATTPGVLANPPAGTVPIPVDSDRRTFGWVLSAVGRIPLGPAAIYGRVGWGAITGKFVGNAAVQDTTTGAITYFNAANRDTNGRVVFGAGASFDFAGSWRARFDWDRTKAEDGLNPEYDVDMYTLGVAYRF